jgi:hypothetical protein
LISVSSNVRMSLSRSMTRWSVFGMTVSGGMGGRRAR